MNLPEINPSTGMPAGVRIDGSMHGGGITWIQFTDELSKSSTFHVRSDLLDRDGKAIAEACARLRAPYLAEIHQRDGFNPTPAQVLGAVLNHKLSNE